MKLHAVQVRVLFFPLGSSSNGKTRDFDSCNTGSILFHICQRQICNTLLSKVLATLRVANPSEQRFLRNRYLFRTASIADWCNGNTSDSDSDVLGSNPRSAVQRKVAQ